MWEEHPEYQKSQAKAMGLLIAVVFIGSVIYSVSNRDWDLVWLVLYAGIGFAVAIAIFPLAVWMVAKAVVRRHIRSTKQPSDEA